jgi:endonuclease/exonuclease/phosphatase family metal-dependent hydrolase
MLLAVAALLRAAGADRALPLAPLMAVTPYLALAAAAAAALAAALRRPAAAVAALAVTGAFAALLVPRALSGGQAPAPPGGLEVTVMTVNLHLGRADATSIVDVVRDEGVDLLAVQELTPQAIRRLRAAGLDSRLPARLTPMRDDTSGLYTRGSLLAAGVNRKERSVTASVQIAGSRLTVTSVHPVPPTTPGSQERWRDVLRALPSASDQGAPRLILGDLNGTLDHAELRRLVDRGYNDAADVTGQGLRPTWFAMPMPPLTLDHVLVDERVHVRSVTLEKVPETDHRALIARLIIPRDA